MKLAAPMLTLALLAGLYLEARGHPRPENARAFHELVAGMVESIPKRIGTWDGVDQPIPQAAQALLRPNAILARLYHDSETGREADLIVVQCRDSRDMAGHYPPRCYPAHGWDEGAANRAQTMRAGSTTIPVSRFEYQRSGLGHDRKIVIYGFFVLPGRGIVTGMDEVYHAAEYYSARPFGAAQIQVVIEGPGDEEMDAKTFDDLVTPLLPTIELLRKAPEEVST